MVLRCDSHQRGQPSEVAAGDPDQTGRFSQRDGVALRAASGDHRDQIGVLRLLGNRVAGWSGFPRRGAANQFTVPVTVRVTGKPNRPGRCPGRL